MKDRVDPGISRAVLVYSLAHSVLNAAWLIKRVGSGSAVRAGALGVGLPALAEVWITSLDRLLRHRMEPGILGVPVAIPLLWFNLIFGGAAMTESALGRLHISDRSRRSLLAPATALTATSLDLVMDCFGLDQGLWEWNPGGPYAAEIRGANGKRGIPLLNFFGWLFLVWTVVYIHQSSSRQKDVESDPQRPDEGRLKKAVILALLPYYAVSAAWAIRQGKVRFLLYSLAFPATMLAALYRRRS